MAAGEGKRAEKPGYALEASGRVELADVESLDLRPAVRAEHRPAEAQHPVMLIDPACQFDRGTGQPLVKALDAGQHVRAPFHPGVWILVDAVVRPALDTAEPDAMRGPG